MLDPVRQDDDLNKIRADFDRELTRAARKIFGLTITNRTLTLDRLMSLLLALNSVPARGFPARTIRALDFHMGYNQSGEMVPAVRLEYSPLGFPPECSEDQERKLADFNVLFEKADEVETARRHFL